MVPLLLAGALAASQFVAPQLLPVPKSAADLSPFTGNPVVQLVQRPAALAGCPRAVMETGSPMSPALLLRPQDRSAVKLQKLGELPKPNLEIAVLRTTADGCQVPVVVSYSVGP